MAQRRMLLNSTESFVGTMRIEYYIEGDKLYLGLNDNIEIIEEYFNDSENGYYVVGFKKDLIVPENFINYNDYCEIEFISEYNIIFDTRSVYAPYLYFNGNFTFNEYSIISSETSLYDYNYIFNDNCFTIHNGAIYFMGKTISQCYNNLNSYTIFGNPHILYDIIKYNNIEEGDEEAQNYHILNNTRLIISSPTEYIRTIANVDLGDNNYIQSVNNYMYEGNYITEYICNSNITYLRTGITLPQNAIVYFPITVTDIDSDTFKRESNLKKVIIFANCELTYLNGFRDSNLENIEIYSNKIIDIKMLCFDSCKLTQFIIPESVIYIRGNVFFKNNLKSLYIPKNVSDISNSILQGNENIETIIVDENNLNYNSKNNCNAIIYNKILIQGCKNTIIPNDINTIGISSFSNMGLKEIIIPNNIIELNGSVFRNNPIDNIIIPKSIIRIGDYCFNDTNIYNNENNWINGILYISNCIVFVKQNISGEITILDNTRLICDSAFHKLSNIIKINIPNSLEYINEYSFANMGDLIIEYDGYEDEWNNISKGTNWDSNTNITYIFKTDVVEPEPEEEIPTFEGTPPNNQIWYTSTDEEIVEPVVLYKDTNLSEQLNIVKNKYYTGLGGVIETDGDIICLEENEFCYKNNLKSIKFPNSLIDLGSYYAATPLSNCENLEYISIGINLESVQGGFARNCKNLNNVTVDTNNKDYGYYSNDNNAIISNEKDYGIFTVPIIIKQATNNTSIPKNDVIQIYTYAFSGLNIENIKIPNNVNHIYYNAFDNCKNLKTVELPNTGIFIEEYAFCNCINLSNINIPIDNTFYGNSLENTAIWNKEENWYNNGLYWDNALIYIRDTDGYNIYIVKSGTKTICSHIDEGKLNSGISIKLPNSVQNILDYAFMGSNITELYYDGTVDEWNNINKSDLWNANSSITVIHCVDEDIQL